MDDAERLAGKAEEAAWAGAEVRRILDRLVAEGLAPDAVMAGALAHVVASMTVALGGDVAAQAVVQIVRQVSGLPSADAIALAAAAPAGRA